MFALVYDKIKSRADLTSIFYALAAQTFFQVVLTLVLVPRLERYATGKMLDLRIRYTGADAWQYFTQLGPDGRNAYALTLLVDFLYPLAYTATFILLILFLSKFAFKSDKAAKASLVLPVLLFLADNLENIAELLMLHDYPRENAFYHIAGNLTLIKYILLSLNLALVSLIALVALKKEFFRKV